MSAAETRLRDALEWATRTSPGLAAALDGAPALTWNPVAGRLEAANDRRRWTVTERDGQIVVASVTALTTYSRAVLLPRDLRSAGAAA